MRTMWRGQHAEREMAEAMNAPPNDFDKAYWGEQGIDISRWKGGECARGVRYIETGAPVKSGTAGQVRKMSSGRKHRGMSSDGVKTK
jgi:hypothetical protein